MGATNWIEYLRGYSIAAIALRLLLAMLIGGVIGFERGRKRRAAGSRTYMLVCIGATCAILLGAYDFGMQKVLLAEGETARTYDVSRYGAQVINGIGFLGAGTIMISEKRGVKGLTTAVALWASACTGLAIGAGFYECAVLALILIFVSVRLLPKVEERIVARSRDMNLRVEFISFVHVNAFLQKIKAMDISIHTIEVYHGSRDEVEKPNLFVSLRLPKGIQRTSILPELSQLADVTNVKEV